MADLDKLLLRREHFPVDLHETTGYKGERYWDFGRIEIPPYHPSMRETGIPFEIVPSIVEEALEDTIKDFESIAEKRRDAQTILQDVVRNAATGKLRLDYSVSQDELGITLGTFEFETEKRFPIVGNFWVGRKGMNPYCSWGDQGIAIYPECSAKSFSVPEDVEFSPELMREYEMTDGRIFLGKRRIECPNGWYRHNLATINAIFYKNLVTALDNAVVREKYSDKTTTSPE